MFSVSTPFKNVCTVSSTETPVSPTVVAVAPRSLYVAPSSTDAGLLPVIVTFGAVRDRVPSAPAVSNGMVVTSKLVAVTLPKSDFGKLR